MSATFLVLAYGEAGHTLPMLSIVEGLIRRGHRALVYAPRKFTHGVVAAGGESREGRTFGDPFERMMQLRASRKQRPVHQVVRDVVRGRAGMVGEIVRMAREWEDVIRTERVDGVVSFMSPAARYAAELTGRPFASVGPNPLMLFGADGKMVLPPNPMMKYLPRGLLDSLMGLALPLARCREELGLPPRKGGPSEFFHTIMSDTLHLVTVHEGFYPPGPRGPGQLCVGPMSYSLPRPQAAPFPVDTLAPGTVLVSTTTLPMDGGLFRRTLEALAPLKVPLLATAAGAADIPEGLGAHVRLESFVPHDQVLPHVSALVTHGGWGTTGRALRQGVPMLITPLFGDQPLIGARLAEMGLAYHLPRKQATKEAIQKALAALLQDTALHQRVRAVAQQLQALDSPRLAAEALEKLVARPGSLRSAA
ncbi:glycosyl transferase [Cystobacter fuscus]|uniref:Glycosyl transferase n=1 Tax=Cystobacter fuscus TaxID=43 RepID=A0A250JAC6_9BACT|nr:glycosyltransferase [Cystobacter fuscus]ATB40371.1 glycosyl transferase [Cystobacter fuscus]